MGEYIKYKGDHVKIGTMEDLYYTSFQKYKTAYDGHLLQKAPNNGKPEDYLKPDIFRFRFPFPDEDHLPLGDIGKMDYDRKVDINISGKLFAELTDCPFDPEVNKDFIIGIQRQKLVHRESDNQLILALVAHDPTTGESFRIEDDVCIKKLAKEVMRNHVSGESDPQKKRFFRALATRIMEGYKLETPAQRVGWKQNNAHQKHGKKL